MKRGFVALLLLTFAITAMAQQPLTSTTRTSTPANPSNVLPVGTSVKMKLETIVSTIASNPGDNFSGRVTENVIHNGQVVIPVGANVEGKVIRVSEPRRIKGRPSINLRPDTITMPNGQQFAFAAYFVDVDPSTRLAVDEEGRIKGSGIDRRDKLEMGAGTAGGLLIGSVWGTQGAVVGAIIGASATAGRWLYKRRSAVLPAGTEVTLELYRPMTLTPTEAGN